MTKVHGKRYAYKFDFQGLTQQTHSPGYKPFNPLFPSGTGNVSKHAIPAHLISNSAHFNINRVDSGLSKRKPTNRHNTIDPATFPNPVSNLPTNNSIPYMQTNFAYPVPNQMDSHFVNTLNKETNPQQSSFKTIPSFANPSPIDNQSIPTNYQSNETNNYPFTDFRSQPWQRPPENAYMYHNTLTSLDLNHSYSSLHQPNNLLPQFNVPHLNYQNTLPANASFLPPNPPNQPNDS
uniref:ETS domain-containing protein n=1 Tax=Rhabditophanes sp. KR3021 TaxID=114890 RepID=A0AC35TNR8_9BILA